MLRIRTHSEAETEQFAEALAQKLRGGDVLALRGGLGAGKTAFTRGLARGLKVKGPVTSPTFALVHEYRGKPLSLLHYDMYRVTGEDALFSTGFYDDLGRPDAVLCIEWSENIADALREEPVSPIIVTLRPADAESVREITVEGDGRF